jgi:hypothetical protein
MSYIGNEPTSVAFLTDTFSGNGSTTAFTLSAAPATTSSILVAITGVLQDPSTYSVSGTTLTFSPAPPTGTGNISVRFLGIPASGVTTTAYRTVTEFTATSGQTTFSVPSYTVGFIDVYRNGVMLGSADYTASNGVSVVLANGATAGDLVEVISFQVSSVLNAIPATAGSVGTTFLADNSVTTAKIAAGAVVQADLASGVAGNGPAFSAYIATQQTLSSGVATKMQCATEEFDTASCYDNITNYRFTPNVAGYYQVNGEYDLQSGSPTRALISVWKNGSEFKRGNDLSVSSGNLANGAGSVVSALVYLNGSTDYIELYAFYAGGGVLVGGNQTQSYFQAFLARAA